MAKTAKKKSSKKKSNQESSGSGFVTLLIVLVVIGAAAYGMFFRPGATGIPDIPSFVKAPAEDANSTPIQEPQKPSEASKTAPQTAEKKKEAPAAEKIDRSDITALDGKVEKVKTNDYVPEYKEENPYYFTSSFDFAWPAYTREDAIVEHEFYTLRYNEKTEQADWVAYKLTANNLTNNKFKRTDNFREDLKVNTLSAEPDDYKGSGYDRGHLAPAADFTWNKTAMDESFYMSNMSPQIPGFNRGVWKRLEEKTRDMAKSNKEIFIVTGPIFDSKSKKIGKNKVAIPDRYYKVILELQGKEVKGIGFILNHEGSSADLSAFAMSIDEVEKATSLDFFPSMPDDLESKIECCARYTDW